ncbi:MAG: ribosomal protein L33, partial [Candidatus Paceibacteria bacterium]
KETLYVRKNKKGVERKLELKKYSKVARKRVIFKEVKK